MNEANEVSKIVFDVDIFIAIVSAFIALCALGLSVISLMFTRKHNRLSVRPHLRIDFCRKRPNDCKIIICNHGLGPAIIEDIYLYSVNTQSKIRIYEFLLIENISMNKKK